MSETDLGQGLVKALWWLVLLRGVLAVVFGLYALFAPESALLALVLVFGFYAIMDGVAALVVGVRNRGGHWGWHVAQGLVSVLAGVIAVFWPGPTVLALVLIVAIWSIALGIAQLVDALAARREGEAWVWPLLGGVVGVVFGIVLIVSPAAGALVLLWIIGLSTLVLGTVFIVWAFRLRAAVRTALGTS